MSLMMAVDTSWQVGYQQGLAEGIRRTSRPAPAVRTIVKRVTVDTGRAAMLTRIRELAEATTRNMKDRAGVLVEFGKAQHNIFEAILADLATFEEPASAGAVDPVDGTGQEGPRA